MFEAIRRKQAEDPRTNASKKADMGQVKFYLWRWVGIIFLLGAVIAWLLFLNKFAIFLLVLALGAGFMSLRSLIKAGPEILEAAQAETARGLIQMDHKYRKEGSRARTEVAEYSAFILKTDDLSQVHYDYANALLDMVEGAHTAELEQELKSHREYLQAMYNLSKDR